ncbi:MAG: STAS domain-containing protein [Planctomycetaceae bacterium]
MTFAVVQGNEQGSLRLTGELDVAEADAFIERASSEVPPDGDLVLELGELTFIDSSGVRALVTIAGMLRSGTHLVLQDPMPAVRRVFDLIGIDEAAAAIEVRASNGSDRA